MRLDQLVSKFKQIPSSPQVLPKLQTLLRNPNSDLGDIVEIIRTDSGLVAELIRLANSALYARGMPVSDLESAINLLGFHQTYRATAIAIGTQALAIPLPLYRMQRMDLFVHSLSAATLMEELARLSRRDSDAAYTLGLLHACGKIIVQYGWTVKQVPPPARVPDTAMEREAVQFTYAEAGAALMQHWKFPEEFCLIIKMHADPTAGYAELPLAYQLHMAALAAPVLLHHDDPTPFPVEIFQGAKLEEGMWRAALETARERITQILRDLGS